jgi:LDH2 family malate/lactate/ureidoglycolate dehydrogenase
VDLAEPSVALESLQAWAEEVLVQVGLREPDAAAVAATLGFAEARGVSSHGFLRLVTYVSRIQAGGINADARVAVIADHGALVIIDGDAGPGAVVGIQATDLAIERARQYGVSYVGARNTNHFGAAGFYTNRIADAGLLGVAVCNTESVMCAPFGGRPVLGTNPLALAVPLPAERRPQLDMATTTTSQGKLMLAARDHQPIPLGWAVDGAGVPTVSPTDALAGALLPSGGPKGFGLAFAVDALVAIAGANVSPSVAALNGDPAVPQGLGHAFLAIRVDGAEPISAYRERLDGLVDAIHASGNDPGSPSPLAPGEPELRRVHEGAGRIEPADGLLVALSALADELGLPRPPS